MLFVRKVTTPREPAPRLDVIQVGSVHDLRDEARRIAVQGSADSDLVLGFGQGGVSRASFRTSRGSKWKCAGSVTLVEEGAQLPIRFGPVFYDERDSVVAWWPNHEGPARVGAAMPLEVEIEAPEGAFVVRLGMLGPWRKGEASTALYKFEGCYLQRLTSNQS